MFSSLICWQSCFCGSNASLTSIMSPVSALLRLIMHYVYIRLFPF